MLVSDFLSKGEGAAIHLCDLCRLTGESATSVKSAIRRERLAGVPIISSASGYWLAASEAEIEGFSRMMRAQGRSRFEVSAAVCGAGIGGGIEQAENNAPACILRIDGQG